MTGPGWTDPSSSKAHLCRRQLPPLRRFKFVSPGFLGTLGMPLVAGREITWNDTYKKIPVAMISEN